MYTLDTRRELNRSTTSPDMTQTRTRHICTNAHKVCIHRTSTVRGYALIMTASRAAARAATAAPATGAPRATAAPAAETV